MRPGLTVSLPARRLDGAERPPTWPHPLGGQNGTIALPSRNAALEGAGTFQRPGPRHPGDGAFGPVALFFRGLLDWSGKRLFSWPLGAGHVVYDREAVPNIGPITDFAPPRDGPTDWTLNASEETRTSPASPVPWSRRRVQLTFYSIYENALQAIYWPRDRMQQGGPHHGGQGAGAEMIHPYFPRLTRFRQAGSFGQQTEEL